MEELDDYAASRQGVDGFIDGIRMAGALVGLGAAGDTQFAYARYMLEDLLADPGSKDVIQGLAVAMLTALVSDCQRQRDPEAWLDELRKFLDSGAVLNEFNSIVGER